MEQQFDVIVIGGGQSGLATGYYLRRTGLKYIILDNQNESGGAWLHSWKSLRLFSPAQWSSLPGLLMTGADDVYPGRDSVIQYLKFYEAKYNLPVKRPVKVNDITKDGNNFVLQTTDGIFRSKAIVSATGSFSHPFIPEINGIDNFAGEIIHSSQYYSPEKFIDKKVAIVGEGNSGAQILAELSEVTETLWITQKPPRFLPDHIDGRYLFDAATQMYEAQKNGKEYKPPSLGDIVMVEPVRKARDRKVLNSLPPFEYFSKNSLVWSDGHEEKVDAVIFCTGFKPSLDHLKSLNVNFTNGKIETQVTRVKGINGLWLVGYGNWTGFASATLIGVGRSAKKTVDELAQYISSLQIPS